MPGVGGRPMKSPAFRFYPADFMGSPDVQAMDLEEVGAYVFLLCMAWQSERHGHLEDNEDRLRRLARMSPTQWARSRDLLLRKFPVVEPGWRANARMVLEAGKQQSFSESQSAKGKRGGRPRKADDKLGLSNEKPELSSGLSPEKPSVSVSASASVVASEAASGDNNISGPSEPHPDASLSGDNAKGPQLVSMNPKNTRKRKTELGTDKSYSPQFLAAYGRYPKHEEKSASEDQWFSAVRRLQRGEKDKPAMSEVEAIAYLEDAAADYATKMSDTEDKFIRSMRRWLHDKTYLDYDPKAKVEYVEVDPAKWWEGDGAQRG
jgi:uncharacterized protein YdaU (DUF1376 family)